MNKRTFLRIKKCITPKLNLLFVVALLAAGMGLQTWVQGAYAADVYVDVSNAGSGDGSETNPYRSIMAAINHSTWGDTVRVAPGIYYENVVMKDYVNLIGADPETTVIDANGSGSVVETSNNATLSGFTIRNGTGGRHWYIARYRNGGGIKCDRKNTTIENNIITGNYQRPWTSLYGGGIFLWASTATVRNNVIVGNRSWYGSGIYTYGGSPKIINNTFVHNQAQYSWYSQTILLVSSPALVVNNILYSNDAGEIWNLGSRTRGNIAYNNFWDNRITSYTYYHYIWRQWITYDNEEGFHAVLADPKFVGASSGDYHLTAESPCINTGHPYFLDPDGTRSDIGAFYFPMLMKPDYKLTSKKANRGSLVSESKRSERAKAHANENAAFNRVEGADYTKLADADAVLETDGIFVLDRAVKLIPGDYGSELPETTYLAVILGEYYPVVWVAEDRKSFRISGWSQTWNFPLELLDAVTEMELPHIAIEFYQDLSE
jgi:hypothetical protein